MQNEKTATLILDDGHEFRGYCFGYEKAVAGEVVFNTAMTGYPESLTDPSYAGQLMVLTYPLVGNYGVPTRRCDPTNGLSTVMESEKIHVDAMIVSDYSHDFCHWNAVDSLSDWLKREQIPGLYGVDTRSITKILREKGSMKGKIILNNPDEVDFYDPNAINQVARVSCREVITYGAGGTKKIILLDCGVKHNIIRCLLKRGLTVIRVPWDYDFHTIAHDGLFISNGHGDPDTCDAAVQHIRRALSDDKPICGICMGNQLLAKAGGASIYKLKYGHRSHNQPVRMVGTNRCFITSQNHGYAVDGNTLGADWEPLFVNMNDDTNEGIRHKTKPFFSSQFHPEACSGPTDTEFIFDRFAEMVVKMK